MNWTFDSCLKFSRAVSGTLCITQVRSRKGHETKYSPERLDACEVAPPQPPLLATPTWRLRDDAMRQDYLYHDGGSLLARVRAPLQPAPQGGLEARDELRDAVAARCLRTAHSRPHASWLSRPAYLPLEIACQPGIHSSLEGSVVLVDVCHAVAEKLARWVQPWKKTEARARRTGHRVTPPPHRWRAQGFPELRGVQGAAERRHASQALPNGIMRQGRSGNVTAVKTSSLPWRANPVHDGRGGVRLCASQHSHVRASFRMRRHTALPPQLQSCMAHTGHPRGCCQSAAVPVGKRRCAGRAVRLRGRERGCACEG